MGSPSNSAEHPGCEGCQWRSAEPDGGWCRMFSTIPRPELPCTQHDKFELERRAFTHAFNRMPRGIQQLAILGMIEEAKSAMDRTPHEDD